MANELPTNGNICIIDGAYYPVNFQWIPRNGDLLQLTSMIEISSCSIDPATIAETRR
jgi:hypothetical protein